jgi:hypothetical protein
MASHRKSAFSFAARGAACAICAAALLCAAADVPAQTVLKKGGASGRYVPITSQRAAAVEAGEAARRLERAKRARELGARPRHGERAEGADFNQRYWQRQEKLRRDVEVAQRRSNETLRRQHAQR